VGKILITLAELCRDNIPLYASGWNCYKGIVFLAEALQRNCGRLFPLGLLDIMLEMRRTHWLAINAGGILPEYQGLGGNALLYAEGMKMLQTGRFTHAAAYQVAETAIQMRQDLETVGAVAYKNHRVYKRAV